MFSWAQYRGAWLTCEKSCTLASVFAFKLYIKNDSESESLLGVLHVRNTRWI